MTARPVTVSDDDLGVRTIRIDRPQARNALNLETKSMLVDALVEADANPAVRAVVLTGTAEVFVAGTDIKEMARLTPTDHLVRETGRVFDVLDALSVPTIAAVEGYALGGGCELAMACDLVVAGDSAQFGQPEIKVGLLPGAGGLSRLVQRAGRARALHLVLTGDMVVATEARDLGIVSQICTDGDAEQTALTTARAVAARAPLNVRAIRRIARTAENSPLSSSMSLERSLFQTIFDTVDHTEGLTAFLEKRQPEYTGR